MQLKQILVPLAGSAVDPDVIRLVAAIAKPNKSKVLAVHVIEVRWNMPLDAVLDEELDRGEALLQEATKLAEQSGITLETELLQAREAAAAIVDTARTTASDMIVIGMPYRKRMGKVYVGRTVQDVYVSAPCAVLAYRQEEPR